MSQVQQVTAPLGTFGEQIARKQSGVDLRALVTASPSAREQRKGSGKAVAAPKGFRFTAPTLVRPVLSVQDDAIRQQALASLEEFKVQIGPYMQDLAVSIRQVEQLSEDERQLATGDWDAIQGAVAEALNASDSLAKQLATVAYADAMIRTCPEGRGWVITTLRDLTEKGFLTDDGPKPETSGPFRPKVSQICVYSRLYSLAPAFSHSEEAQGVLSVISSLVSRAVAAGREYYENRRDEAIALAGPAESQLTLDQLQSPTCPNGFRHLPVPEQKWNDRDGNPRFRKEGGIIVQMVRNEKGSAITMVAGYGGAEHDAEKIRSANAFVTPASLRHDRLPLNQRLEPAQYWAITQLHRLVRLGIGEAAEQEKRNSAKADFNAACYAEKEALTLKATLTAEEFLIGEKVGSAVVRWTPRAFEWRKFDPVTKKPTVVWLWHLFALLERSETGQIKVADCPDRLREFWAGHRDFETAGQEYSELGKAGIILRQAKRNLIRAAEKAAASEKTGSADANEPAAGGE